MAMHGKLEGLVTIPTGNYTISVTDSGATEDVILSAGNTYYWSTAGNDSNDLADAFQAALNDVGLSLAGTYTVTISAGDGGTGKLTIACDENFTATWTDADFRDLCGFSGNISSTQSATGANHVTGLWLPQCPAELLFGSSDEGYLETDAVTTVAPTGACKTTIYNTRTANEIRWLMVEKARTRTVDESTSNESFQTFMIDVLHGGAGWASAGGPVRWYPDADVDGTSTEYHVSLPSRIEMARAIDGYDGYYRITMPKLYKVP